MDIVPQVPPPLLYFHVGDETELVPSATSQLKFDVGCEHHLTTCLHLLSETPGKVGTFPLDPDWTGGAAALPGMRDPSAP